MSVITKGKTFSNGEQLTAGKLNQMLDAATFSSAAVDNTKTTLSGGAITIAPNGITATEIAQSFLDTIYPIGSVYTNATDGTNPGTLLGFGTWVEFAQGEVPVGKASSGTFDTAGNTGGAETHPLTESELPEHYHLAVADGTVSETGDVTSSNAISENATQSGSTFQSYRMRPATSSIYGTVGRTSRVGSDSAHNNLQPYIVVYMWKRTA
jgi:hypothetical protein